jgi:hypothetical protein
MNYLQPSSFTPKFSRKPKWHNEIEVFGGNISHMFLKDATKSR